MLFCSFARGVWTEVKSTYSVELNRKCFHNPKQWFFEFFSRCNSQEATVLADTLWHLWDARNTLREEGGSLHPSTVAMKIKIYVDMIITHLFNTGTNPYQPQA